jgi:hypothetical protein
MKKLIWGLLTACLLAGPWAGVAAEEPELKSDYPESYTVRRGDTLWDISETFLQNPWMWPEIWHANPQIDNPHLIYPGDVVRLIYLDGKPRLTLDRGERVYKLSPKTRVLEGDEAINTIPLSEINSFLSRSRIVNLGDLEQAPHVVAGHDKRLIVGAGDRLYARGSFPENLSTYGVYRRGDVYRDPETGEVLGVQALDIGSAKLRATEGEIATLAVTRTTEEIRIGDRFLAEEERPVSSFFLPSRPEGEVKGEILAVEGGVSQVGRLDVVVINRGRREAMEVGDVLAVYKRGGEIRDRVKGDSVTLPDERAGLLMIFRTFDKVSLGLVVEAERPLAVRDLIRNP